ncbi:hypothetical protein GEMRC1_012476 [Eukaryota sp. GEM-RC1]
MGRRKIDIAYIPDSRSRQVTYSKRKNGLLKKAAELATLCNCTIGLVVINNESQRVTTFHSSDVADFQSVMTKFNNVRHTVPVDTKNTFDVLKIDNDDVPPFECPMESQDPHVSDPIPHTSPPTQMSELPLPDSSPVFPSSMEPVGKTEDSDALNPSVLERRLGPFSASNMQLLNFPLSDSSCAQEAFYSQISPMGQLSPYPMSLSATRTPSSFNLSRSFLPEHVFDLNSPEWKRSRLSFSRS